MAPLPAMLSLGLLVANSALAHPGHSSHAEAAERAEFFNRSPKTVRSCASDLVGRGLKESMMMRRAELAGKVRAKRNLTADKPLVRRDFAAYNFSHEATGSYGGDELALFEDDSSCILQPEVTQGPYYIDGELIRRDIVEDQEGVPLYLDIQLVDTSTCEPVPAVFMDIWHCNSTGVYSGTVASGNGNSDDETNLDNTFLRGIQESDSNGVVQFETLVPGHYTGRATHIHVLTHNINETTIRTNGTILGTNFTTFASHVGQIFFDQDLISQVEETAPYNTNTQELTLNSEDDILSSEAADMDPFVEYVMLTDDISDGILAWISIGIDPTVDDDVSSAGSYYKSGGVANENSGMGMGGGGAPPGGISGSTPSMPSGTAAPSS